MDTIGKRLKKLRQEKNWTLNEVAEKLGLKGFSTYSNWEYDRTEPDAVMLVRLARLYEVTVDYLLGGSESKGGYLTDEESVLLAEKIMELPENKRRVIEELLKSYED